MPVTWPDKVRCAECGKLAGWRGHGWKAFLADDPETNGQVQVVLYCAECAERAFGSFDAGAHAA